MWTPTRPTARRRALLDVRRATYGNGFFTRRAAPLARVTPVDPERLRVADARTRHRC